MLKPTEIIRLGYLTGVGCEATQVQPNGVDIRVDKVWEVVSGGFLPADPHLIEDGGEDGESARKVPPRGTELCAVDEGKHSVSPSGVFRLSPGKAYQMEAFEHVKVPPHLMAEVIGRSSLNRAGVFLRSTLYDSGFCNQIGLVAYPSVEIGIQRGARIAQIVFSEATSGHLYDGQYQGTDEAKPG